VKSTALKHSENAFEGLRRNINKAQKIVCTAVVKKIIRAI
jgi:hypothetical protein